VTPEAADYLRKARDDLDEAHKIADIGLANVAGRSAYYAAFHAAEAFIMERTGKIATSHKGVRIEFARLAKDEPSLREFTAFLVRAYDLKAIADYSVSPNVQISLEDAAEAIATATVLIGRISDLISGSS
jgi:uncharacterized protein (UPF0332 family)